MNYNVTQDDISLGVMADPHNCPVGLAIKRVHGDVYVEVGDEYIVIDGKEFDTPSIVATFIGCFDWDVEVDPIEFALRDN